MSFKTLDSLLLLLFSKDDERSTVLVECKTHFVSKYKGIVVSLDECLIEMRAKLRPLACQFSTYLCFKWAEN
mgnify:CR=1 FL=1